MRVLYFRPTTELLLRPPHAQKYRNVKQLGIGVTNEIRFPYRKKIKCQKKNKNDLRIRAEINQ